MDLFYNWIKIFFSKCGLDDWDFNVECMVMDEYLLL